MYLNRILAHHANFEKVKCCMNLLDRACLECNTHGFNFGDFNMLIAI